MTGATVLEIVEQSALLPLWIGATRDEFDNLISLAYLKRGERDTAKPPSDARSPLSLKFGDVEFLADWTTGRTFDQSIRDGSTVQARLSESYLLLGGDAEEFLRWAAVSNDLIVRFDGQGVEPDAEIHVRTANAENAVPEMLECMRALRAP